MNKKKKIFLLIIVFITIGVFGLIMYHQLKHGDFPGYIQYSREFSKNGYLYKIPHTLLERLIVIIRALLPANILVWISPLAKQIYDLKAFEISTLILMVFCYTIVVVVLFNKLVLDIAKSNKDSYWIEAVATFSIVLVGPIFLFTFPDRMFLGYITGNRYDSPTYVLLKPFALLAFIYISDNIFSSWNWRRSLIMAGVIFCATLAKPNFTISIIPSLAILLAIHWKKIMKVNWWYLIFAVGFPAFIVLLSQFIINYTGDRGDRLIFAPFKSILIHVPNLYLEAVFILLSILFPLIFTLFKWKEIRNNLVFQLAWINFFVGLFIGLTLTEVIYVANNNVWNSPMIAVFLLFFVTISYWAKDIRLTFVEKHHLNVKQVISTSILALHLISGVIYYVATMLNTGIIVN